MAYTRTKTTLKGVLTAGFYSVRPLDEVLRRDFELPGDPYDRNEEIAARGRGYLYELGVFFYRDELHIKGVIIQPKDEDDTPLLQRHNFMSYGYITQLDYNNLTPLPWEDPTQEYLEKHPDGRVWVKWGEERNCVQVTPETVTLT